MLPEARQGECHIPMADEVVDYNGRNYGTGGRQVTH